MRKHTVVAAMAAVVLSVAGIFYSFAHSAAAAEPAKTPASGPTSKPTTTKSTSNPTSQAVWTILFEKEAWYKQQAGEEKYFKGTLESVANADGPSTLQRASYYRLGDRTIYTGAKKVDALDKLVGKKVEIKGKPYDINLEGHEVSEIWPAKIKEQ